MCFENRYTFNSHKKYSLYSLNKSLIFIVCALSPELMIAFHKTYNVGVYYCSQDLISFSDKLDGKSTNGGHIGKAGNFNCMNCFGRNIAG